MTRKRGSTLIELLVTLVIMAIVASVVTLALRPTAPRRADNRERVELAKRAAREGRRPVTIELSVNSAPVLLTALPDGGVIGDTALRIHRLSGAPIHAP
jgi:prepilin-type N-terminal cleavage/methylation domain-containing protein